MAKASFFLKISKPTLGSASPPQGTKCNVRKTFSIFYSLVVVVRLNDVNMKNNKCLSACFCFVFMLLNVYLGVAAGILRNFHFGDSNSLLDLNLCFGLNLKFIALIKEIIFNLAII